MAGETLNAKANCNIRTKNSINYNARQNCENKAKKQEQGVTVKAGAEREMLMQTCNNKAKNSTNFRYQTKLKKQCGKAKA